MARRKVLIASDTCPIGINEPYFIDPSKAILLSDLASEFEAADLVFLNLECPLVSEPTPTKKIGPNLSASIDCVRGLKEIGVDVVGLANNHIMDHGPRGLHSTISALRAHGINCVGAGDNLSVSGEIVVSVVDGLRIGILAAAESEFGIATDTSSGAYPIDIIDIVRNIHSRRTEFDFLIVILHAGNEYYQFPRPHLQQICQFLVECGAGAVICQHTHCVGCIENYRGAPIVYGHGNFIFDYPSVEQTWHEGTLVVLEIGDDLAVELRLVPYDQSLGGPGAKPMNQERSSRFLTELMVRSSGVSRPEFIQHQWRTFCEQQKRAYLHSIHGQPGLLRRLAGKFDLLHLFDSKEVQRIRLNTVRCESHREALISVLERASSSG